MVVKIDFAMFFKLHVDGEIPVFDGDMHLFDGYLSKSITFGGQNPLLY